MKFSILKRMGKLFLKLLLFSAICLFVLFSVYTVYLSLKIENRFSGRRWNIPSKVYSDKMLIFPGQKMNRDYFKKKLIRLGYKELDTKNIEKGEFFFGETTIDVFLKDIILSDFVRSAFPVQIEFYENIITDVKNQFQQKALPFLEIEPEELMLFFGPERERRNVVSIRNIPESLIHAVLSAEDRRFYSHWGVDPAGLIRAFYKNLKHKTIKQGGSTLTQQLSKNYFLTPERTITRKLKELLISLIIEGLFDKDEILEIYLNEIYLGQNGSVAINGFGEAALFYFGKEISDLSLHECAVLAGLIKAPNSYSPYVNIDRCKKRRDAILNLMYQNGYISEAVLITSAELPIETAGFRTYGRKAPYFMDYLSRQLRALYPSSVLNNEGLTIYTTLDMDVQIAAEKALENGLERLENAIPSLKRETPVKKLQGAVIVVQPRTGNILAMVGGRNYGVSQFNRITDAIRQPGSAFKPFILLSALDIFNVTTEFNNTSLSYKVDGSKWTPKNFSKEYPHKVSMREALSKSYNIAIVDLAMKTGIEKIVQDLSKFEFSTPFYEYPSLALGAYEVKPIDLARAYCVFPSDGVLSSPLSIKRVFDENGETIERRHMDISTITTPEKSFLINSMLQSVVSDGTAKYLKTLGFHFPIAGKTGTTNNSKDAWFVGYTPDILALVWVGFDNGNTIHSTGSSAALPIWADLIKDIPAFVSGKPFKIPAGIVKKKICLKSRQLFNKSACEDFIEEVFLVENVPSQKCRKHVQQGTFDKLIDRIKKIVR